MKKKSLITNVIFGVLAFVFGLSSLCYNNNFNAGSKSVSSSAQAAVITDSNFSSSDAFAVNGKGFSSFDSAYNSITNGETLTLLKDCTATSTITISKNMSIDLNGHNLNVSSAITVSADCTLNIYNSATKTSQSISNIGNVVTDSNGVTSSGSYNFLVNGTLNVYGGKFVNTSTGTSAIFCAGASSAVINVYDGNFNATSTSSANGFTMVAGVSNVTMNSYGGYWLANGAVINMDASGTGAASDTVNIFGGNYYSVNDSVVYIKGVDGVTSTGCTVMPTNGKSVTMSGTYGIKASYAYVVVVGGTITGRTNSALDLTTSKTSAASHYVKVFGGNMTGSSTAVQLSYSNATIYGGSFTSNQSYALDSNYSIIVIYGGKFTSSSANINLYTGWLFNRTGSCTVNGGAFNNTSWSTSTVSQNGTKTQVGSYNYIYSSNNTTNGKYYVPSSWLDSSFLTTRSTKAGTETIQVNGSSVNFDLYAYTIATGSSIMSSINNSSSLTLTRALAEDIIINKEIVINKNGQSITGSVKAGEGYILTETDSQIVVKAYDNYNVTLKVKGGNYLDGTVVDNFAGVTVLDHTGVNALSSIKKASTVYFSLSLNEGYRVVEGFSVRYSLDGINYTDITNTECEGVYIIPEIVDGAELYLEVMGVSNVYYVTYVNYNGEQFGTEPERVLYKNSPTGAINGQTINTDREGYTFNGWGASLTTPASDVYNLSTISVEDDLVLYAIYSINYYNVKFYDYNKTTELGAENLAYGSTITPPSDPTRIGYRFVGWSTEPNATTANVIDFTSYTLGASDVNFYAVYERENYTLSSYEDSIYRVTPTTANYDEAVTINIVLHNTSYSLITGVTNYYVYYSLDNGTTWVPVNGTISDGYTIPANTIYKDCLIKVEGITNEYQLVLKEYSDADGKMVDFKTIMVKYGTSFTELNLDNIIPNAREHYDFAGWSDGEASAVITDWSMYKMDNKNGMTLYARYTEKTYTITFRNEDGTTITTRQAKYNSLWNKIGIDSIEAADKEGYDFAGWSTEVGGSKIASNLAIEGNFDVYAIYTKKSFVVTFYNENEEKISSQTVLYGEYATNPGEQVKTGYNFMGWVTSLDSEDVVDISNYEITKKTNFYPYYTIKKYTVEFYANDGDTTPFATQSVNYNRYAVSPDTTPTKTGYKFTGYRVSTAVVNLDTYKITEDTKFYAVYELCYYDVIASGANYSILNEDRTMALTKANYEEDLSFTLLLSSGYHTTGNTVVKYKVGDGEYTELTAVSGVYKIVKTEITDNISILVTGISNEYTVTFMDKDGTNTYKTQTVVYNNAVTYTGATPTIKGSEFLGWALVQNGAIVNLSDYLITENTVFYAVFSINAYVVSFYNGTDLVSSQSISYGGSINTASLPTPTRRGYNFAYWAATEGGERVNLDEVVVDSDKDFYAVFTIASYTVELKYASGENVRESWTAEFGSYTTVPEGTTYTIPTGYKFAGLSLSPNGTILGTTADGKIDAKIEDNTVFYVIFAIENYTVTVEPSSAVRITNPEGTADIMTATYVDDLVFAVVLKEGYSFKSGTVAEVLYGTEGNFKAATYNAETGVYTISGISSNIIIKVTNVTNEYDIKFMVDGEEYSTKTAAYGTDIKSLLPDAPTKTGYNFKGWAIVEDSTSTVTNFGTMPVGGRTYYAVFTEKNFTVVINGENFVVSDVNGAPITSGDSALTYKKSFSFFVDPTEGYYVVSVKYTVDGGQETAINAVGGMYTLAAELVTGNVTLTVVVSNEYTITFKNYDATDINGGVTTTATYGTTWGNVNISGITGYIDRRNDGYTFKGWSLSSGNGRAIADTYMVTGDITVYARYERSSYVNITTEDTFKITNADGAQITSAYSGARLEFYVELAEGYKLPSGETLTIKVTVNGAEVNVTKSGDAFIIETGLLTGDAAITIVNNLNHQVTITFKDWNGSDLFTTDVEYGSTYGENKNSKFSGVSISEPSDTNYKFAGWSTTNGSGATIADAYSFKADTILYPVQVEKQKSSISGGKGYRVVDENGDDLVSFINYSEIKFKILLDEGYRPENDTTIKISYKTTASDTVTTISDAATVGELYTITGGTNAITIIVEGITNYHTVTFKDSNDAETVIATKSVLYQTILTGSLTAVTGYEDRRDLGYTFDGWSLTKGGELIGDDYQVTQNVTLYAHYKLSETVTVSGGAGYTVTDVDGNTLTTAKAGAKLNFKIALADGYYAKDGGIVVRYIIGASSYDLVADGEVYTINTGDLIGDVTIVVTNISNLYKVQFMSGAGVYQTASVAYGDHLTAPTNNPTMQYYTFVGWVRNEGDTNVINVSDLVMPKEDIRLYAYYKPNTYTISSSSPSYSIVSSGTPTYLTDFTFTLTYKNGYHRTSDDLVVYYSVDGGDRQVATVVNETVTIPGSTIKGSILVLVESGITNKYKITYHYGTDNIFSETREIEYNTTTGANIGSVGSTLDNLNSVTGYTFAGWSATNGGEKITNWANYPITSDKDYYAVYTINSYTITFIYGLNKDQKTQAKYTYLTKASDIVQPDASVDGYDWEWNIEISDVTKDETYTAVYTTKSFTVTFIYGLNGEEKETATVLYTTVGVAEPFAATKEGHTHIWKNAEGVVVDLSTETFTGNVTYTAVYTAKTYSVSTISSYYTVDKTTCTFNTELVLTLTFKTGYYAKNNLMVAFMVGNDTTEILCDVDPYVAGTTTATIVIPADSVTDNIRIKVTSEYSNVYTITYHYGEDNLKTYERDLTYGNRGTLISSSAPTTTAELPGRTLAGWASENGGEVITNWRDITVTGAMDFYAVYTNNTYSVSSGETNKYSLSISELTYGEDNNIVITLLNGYRRNGETLKVVYTLGTEAQTYDCTIVSNNGNIIVKVPSSAITANVIIFITEGISNNYSITYHYGVNNETEKVRSLAYKSSGSTILAYAPDKEETNIAGRTLAGWSLTPNADAASDLTSYELTSDINLYAVYSSNSYSVFSGEADKYILSATSAKYGTDLVFTITLQNGYHRTDEALTIEYMIGSSEERYSDAVIDGEQVTISGSKVTGNITIYVSQTAITNKYTINFVTAPDGSQRTTRQAIYKTKDISSLAPNASVAGYNYTWTIDGSEVDLTDVEVTSNLTVVAKYTDASYSVKVVEQAPYTIVGSNLATHGTDYVFSLAYTGGYRPTDATIVQFKAGNGKYSILTPNQDGSYTISGALITGAITIEATNVTNTRTLRFLAYNGETLISTTEVEYGTTCKAVPPVPQRTGYNGRGWALVGQSTLFDFNNTEITEDISLYAVYELKTYTVTINGDGYTVVNANTNEPLVTITHGQTITIKIVMTDVYRRVQDFNASFSIGGNVGLISNNPTDTDETVYTIDGGKIVGNMEITVKGISNRYSVKFFDKDEQTILSEGIYIGKRNVIETVTMPDAEKVTEIAGYNFSGKWISNKETIVRDSNGVIVANLNNVVDADNLKANYHEDLEFYPAYNVVSENINIYSYNVTDKIGYVSGAAQEYTGFTLDVNELCTASASAGTYALTKGLKFAFKLNLDTNNGFRAINSIVVKYAVATRSDYDNFTTITPDANGVYTINRTSTNNNLLIIVENVSNYYTATISVDGETKAFPYIQEYTDGNTLYNFNGLGTVAGNTNKDRFMFGTDYQFEVVLSSAFFGVIRVYANGEELTPVGNTYTVKNTTGDIVITYTYEAYKKSVLTNALQNGVYKLSTAEQLKALSLVINNNLDSSFAAANYQLINTIDFGGETLVAIGNVSHPFSGRVDGAGYEIKNFVVSENSYAGLFGYTVSATIIDLGVIGTVTSTAAENAGIMIGGAFGDTKIINSYIGGAVNGGNAKVVGQSSSTFVMENILNITVDSLTDETLDELNEYVLSQKDLYNFWVKEGNTIKLLHVWNAELRQTVKKLTLSLNGNHSTLIVSDRELTSYEEGYTETSSCYVYINGNQFINPYTGERQYIFVHTTLSTESGVGDETLFASWFVTLNKDELTKTVSAEEWKDTFLNVELLVNFALNPTGSDNTGFKGVLVDTTDTSYGLILLQEGTTNDVYYRFITPDNHGTIKIGNSNVYYNTSFVGIKNEIYTIIVNPDSAYKVKSVRILNGSYALVEDITDGFMFTARINGDLGTSTNPYIVEVTFEEEEFRISVEYLGIVNEQDKADFERLGFELSKGTTKLNDIISLMGKDLENSKFIRLAVRNKKGELKDLGANVFTVTEDFLNTYANRKDINDYKIEFVVIYTPIYTVNIDAEDSGKLTVKDANNDKLVGDTVKVVSGTVISLIITPNTGYAIDYVKVNGETVNVNKNKAVITINKDATIVVRYKNVKYDINYLALSTTGSNLGDLADYVRLVDASGNVLTSLDKDTKIAGIEELVKTNSYKLVEFMIQRYALNEAGEIDKTKQENYTFTADTLNSILNSDGTLDLNRYVVKGQIKIVTRYLKQLLLTISIDGGTEDNVGSFDAVIQSGYYHTVTNFTGQKSISVYVDFRSVVNITANSGIGYAFDGFSKWSSTEGQYNITKDTVIVLNYVLAPMTIVLDEAKTNSKYEYEYSSTGTEVTANTSEVKIGDAVNLKYENTFKDQITKIKLFAADGTLIAEVEGNSARFELTQDLLEKMKDGFYYETESKITILFILTFVVLPVIALAVILLVILMAIKNKKLRNATKSALETQMKTNVTRNVSSFINDLRSGKDVGQVTDEDVKRAMKDRKNGGK